MTHPNDFLQGDFDAESTGPRKRATPTIGGMVKLAIAGAAMMSLAACSAHNGSQQRQGPNTTKQTVGGLLGAVGGAVIGHQFGGGTGKWIATGVGGLVGMLLGAEVGQGLDKADWAAAQEAERQAIRTPTGNKVVWQNPDTGNYGSVTPIRDGHNTRGEYCREYQTKIVVGGKIHEGYGTACRQPDGSWKVSALDAPLGRDFAEIDFDDNGAPIIDSAPSTRFS